MKVTQIIKDAITASIKAKCEMANKGYKEALTVELDRLDKERKQLLQEVTQEYKKAFMAMLDTLDAKNISYNYNWYSEELKDREDLWKRNEPDYYLNVSSQYADDLKNQISDNELKARKFINDIILELELGANKPNLDALLNSVTF